MSLPAKQTTSIAMSTPDDVFVRGKSLCRELIGKVTFTEMTYFAVTGRAPTNAQVAVLDACLVTLMEHGLTPSAIATRMVYSSAPDAMQAAVAAGIMGVGSVFVGTVEGAAALVARIVGSADGIQAEARRVAEEHLSARRPIPGFGHPLHRPDDPRPPCIFRVAESVGLAGKHIEALRALSSAIDGTYAKHITINATGSIGAALMDAGIPPRIMRGFAILARCAGLVAHVHEEQEKPAMRAIWDAAERAVTYDGKADRR
jgi:citrate synthase